MAASVIRSLSVFGLARPAQACFMAIEEEEFEEDCEEEFREEIEDCFEEEEESQAIKSQVKEPCVTDPNFSNTEITDRLLRFAELISSDVQRYFGRSRDSDTCNVYAGKPCPEVTPRQRHLSSIVRAASSKQCDGPEKLGPLAELFQQTDMKKQGMPMIQRRLPSSFWTEPHPDSLDVGCHTPNLPSCFTDTMHSSTESLTISSSSTPDFGDLLAHWASDRDPSEFTCDYQLP
ncbi:protein PERCC1 [Trichomycterus rosablanca]|uniref:protein PERCC1 n=1 Tax=Trichomycterus rosablanca TaxID=2290929 RepID=UPI002F35E768